MSAVEAGPLLERVRASERDALDSLAAATSGAPLCRLDGTGARPAKHWEGRAAALAELRRDLARAGRTRGATSGPDLVHVRLAEWHERTAQSTLMAGPAWTAYLDGGIGALTELVQDDPTPTVEDR